MNAKQRKIPLLCIILINVTVILTSCRYLGTSSDNPPLPVEERNVPDAIKGITDNQNVEWVAGMWVELLNCTKEVDSIAQNIDSYIITENLIRAKITLQNGLEISQPYFLMVLADGIPVNFKYNKKIYLSYPLNLSNSKQLDIEFNPDFTQNLGRLDFLLFFDGNPKSTYHMTSYTVWLRQSTAPHLPASLLSTVSQRTGLKDSFLGSTYGAWIWNEDVVLSSSDNIGPDDITLHEGELVQFEAIAAHEGYYRTVLILNKQPITVTGNTAEYSYLDWYSRGDNMLHLPIELPTDNYKNTSFFTITTPLEADLISVPCLASPKISVNYQEIPEV